mmetsp:Transcript_36628/g.115224  ORF Transcript_36628/g.115224 Transcript_36628/m.115224 type:complete len:508 (-) Transcript_36628:84-1607(-)
MRGGVHGRVAVAPDEDQGSAEVVEGGGPVVGARHVQEARDLVQDHAPVAIFAQAASLQVPDRAVEHVVVADEVLELALAGHVQEVLDEVVDRRGVDRVLGRLDSERLAQPALRRLVAALALQSTRQQAHATPVQRRFCANGCTVEALGLDDVGLCPGSVLCFTSVSLAHLQVAGANVVSDLRQRHWVRLLRPEPLQGVQQGRQGLVEAAEVLLGDTDVPVVAGAEYALLEAHGGLEALQRAGVLPQLIVGHPQVLAVYGVGRHVLIDLLQQQHRLGLARLFHAQRRAVLECLDVPRQAPCSCGRKHVAGNGLAAVELVVLQVGDEDVQGHAEELRVGQGIIEAAPPRRPGVGPLRELVLVGLQHPEVLLVPAEEACRPPWESAVEHLHVIVAEAGQGFLHASHARGAGLEVSAARASAQRGGLGLQVAGAPADGVCLRMPRLQGQHGSCVPAGIGEALQGLRRDGPPEKRLGVGGLQLQDRGGVLDHRLPVAELVFAGCPVVQELRP